MPSYNIFQINPEKKGQLLLKFESVRLYLTFDQFIEGYHYRFYFSNNPIDAQIDWLNLFSDFINLEEAPTIRSYFGVLTIQIPDGNEYAISLGKAHFYIQNFCTYDFGLQLAERIFEKAKLKHGKHFSSRRSKTITSYGRINELNYESGEAIGFVRGSTNNRALWGKTVSFGQSVKITTRLLPNEIFSLIQEIENALNEPARIHLPRAEIIKEPAELQRLDAFLCEEIVNQGVSVEVDEFTLNSVYFNFIDEYDGFQLDLRTVVDEKRYARRSPIIEDISSSNVKDYLLAIASDGIQLFTVLNDVKVILFQSGQSRITRPIKELLEIVTDDWCCLINGEWMRFSNDYITYLKDQVDNIQLNAVDEVIILHKKANARDERESETEDTLIDRLVEEKGYTKLHRTRSVEMQRDGYQNVEVADLRSETCLYFVKLGNTQIFSYALTQSLTTIALYRYKRIQSDPAVLGVREICVWLIFDERVNNIEQLSEINSITFLIALNDWIMTVKDAGYIPHINIGYRRA